VISLKDARDLQPGVLIDATLEAAEFIDEVYTEFWMHWYFAGIEDGQVKVLGREASAPPECDDPEIVITRDGSEILH